MWLVSKLPSIDWIQLQWVSSLLARHCSFGSPSVPKSRKGVMVSDGPIYVQTMPPDSCVG